MGIFDRLKTRVKGTALVVIDPVIDLQPVTNPRYRWYSVEHYPYNRCYLARYHNTQCQSPIYLQKWYLTGFIELKTYEFATKNDTEKEAWLLIDQAIEQFTRDSVRTFKR